MNKNDCSYERLFHTIQETLSSQFGIPEADISPKAHLVTDLDLDSIDMVDLISIASARYEITLSPADFESTQTLGDFISQLLILLTARNRYTGGH